MRTRVRFLTVVLAIAMAGVLASAQNNWTIPSGGANEKNPNPATPDMVTQGQALFGDNCARCHGKTGVGDGPDGDPQALPADLTDPFRAPLNPDGTLFYKISNGKGAEMPAFKDKLTKDQIWSVVEYIKTLRKPEQ